MVVTCNYPRYVLTSTNQGNYQHPTLELGITISTSTNDWGPLLMPFVSLGAPNIREILGRHALDLTAWDGGPCLRHLPVEECQSMARNLR